MLRGPSAHCAGMMAVLAYYLLIGSQGVGAVLFKVRLSRLSVYTHSLEGAYRYENMYSCMRRKEVVRRKSGGTGSRSWAATCYGNSCM